MFQGSSPLVKVNRHAHPAPEVGSWMHVLITGYKLDNRVVLFRFLFNL